MKYTGYDESEACWLAREDLVNCTEVLATWEADVRICLYVIHVTFTVYLCSVDVRSCSNYVAMEIGRAHV